MPKIRKYRREILTYDSIAPIIREYRHNMTTYLSMAPMDELHVPCDATYVAPKVRPDDDMVTLKVGRGGQMEIFRVPAVLLAKASRYFAEQIPERRVFFFPNETTGIFMHFTSFLWYGNFFGPAIRQYTLKALVKSGDLVELFALANDLEVPSLRNAVLDAVFMRVLLEPDNLPYEMVREIYKKTKKHSSLRNLVIDLVVNMGDKKEVRWWGEQWPNEFLVDCLSAASEDGVVPFEGKDVPGWLEMYGEKMCEVYHLHDEDEDEEEEEEEEKEDIEMGEGDEAESALKAHTYVFPPNPIKHTRARY